VHPYILCFPFSFSFRTRHRLRQRAQSLPAQEIRAAVGELDVSLSLIGRAVNCDKRHAAKESPSIPVVREALFKRSRRHESYGFPFSSRHLFAAMRTQMWGWGGKKAVGGSFFYPTTVPSEGPWSRGSRSSLGRKKPRGAFEAWARHLG
jgi:hypothetical protein